MRLLRHRIIDHHVREAPVAATFGLVHGLAFSDTLRALHLTGRRLVVALLGFNPGREAVQLVVALVLPPLLLLTRSPLYQTLRVVAATARGAHLVGGGRPVHPGHAAVPAPTGHHPSPGNTMSPGSGGPGPPGR